MSDGYSGQVVDIEVARYGLRTFRHIPVYQAGISPSWLSMQRSLARTWSFLGEDVQDEPDGPMELCSTAMSGSHWLKGVCEATCQAPRNAQLALLIELAALIEGVDPVYGHAAPNEDCHCGIYAAHTLRGLREQFGTYLDDIVAVVAAEGQTIIGDRGFRTERARVVAYWCSERVAATAESQFAEAERYSEIESMLTEYGLEEGNPPEEQRIELGFGWYATIGAGGHPLVYCDPGSSKPAEEKPVKKSYGGVWANFAASAVNFTVFGVWHSLWNLSFALGSMALGVVILCLVCA